MRMIIKLEKLYNEMFNNLRSIFNKKSQIAEPYILKGKYDLFYEIHPKSALDDHIVKHGIIQDWIAVHLEELVNEDGIVLDVGANSGLLTLPFAKKHVPKGMVYSFEPDMENYKQLERNIELNHLSNVVPLRIALQDDPSINETEFYIRRAIDGDKLTNRGISSLEKIALHKIDHITVECSTVDKIVTQKQLPIVDFIKIDVEGSEYKVLKGSIDTIKKYHPIIHYEYSDTLDKLTNFSNTSKSFSFLDELGYKQYIIHKEKNLIELKKHNSTLEDCNILSIHKSTGINSSLL
jgi:FkbM family methyltransferase